MKKVPYDFQSIDGARQFGSIKGGVGTIAQPEMVPVSLMKMLGADGEWNGRIGVARSGGRYVCPLPEGYDWNVGILPHDGKILVTRPGMTTLIADPETGTVRKAV